MALPPLSMAAIGGRVFSYRTAGEGPALALLHAAGASSEIWEPQFEAFARHFRVIAWDAPGYGGSDYIDGAAPSAAGYAEVLAAFLDAIEIERAHIVGHGMGAHVAAAFGRLYPERAASVVLVSAAGEVETARAALASDASPEIVAKISGSFSMVPFMARKQALAMIARDELAADMARIAAPLLTIDRVAKAGHYGPLENPQAFNGALAAFLAKPGARGKTAPKRQAKKTKRRKAAPKRQTKSTKGSRDGDRPQRKGRAGDRRKPGNRKGNRGVSRAARGKRRNRRT